MQKSRSWQPQHAGPYGPPWLLPSLRNDTYLSFPAESARKCMPVRPASLYDALVMFWCSWVFFLYYLRIQFSHLIYFTIYINTEQQHKGILWSIFRRCCLAGPKRSGRHIQGQDHCYLCVWKHVALTKRYRRHWMKRKHKESAKADAPLFVKCVAKDLRMPASLLWRGLCVYSDRA